MLWVYHSWVQSTVQGYALGIPFMGTIYSSRVCFGYTIHGYNLQFKGMRWVYHSWVQSVFMDIIKAWLLRFDEYI